MSTINDKLLYIPKKINVGYTPRSDTYTKKLAYVIYWDDKGVLRKETSWERWRDKKINPDTFDNTPIDGFVLNRQVGGVKASYNWNKRNEYVRVYDPRGFEFEISVENLLFILQECTSTKGKGIEGKFVYSWSGPELVLLPVDSELYQISTNFTSSQTKKVSAKELIIGATYKMKDLSTGIYIGRKPIYHIHYEWEQQILSEKAYIFEMIDTSTMKKKYGKICKANNKEYYYMNDVKNISECIDTSVNDDIAEKIVAFEQSPTGKRIISAIPINFTPYTYKEQMIPGENYKPNKYIICQNNIYAEFRILQYPTYINQYYERLSIKNNMLSRDAQYLYPVNGILSTSYDSGYKQEDLIGKVEFTDTIEVTLEDGTVIIHNLNK